MYNRIHWHLNGIGDPCADTSGEEKGGYKTGSDFWDDVGPYRDMDFEDLWARIEDL